MEAEFIQRINSDPKDRTPQLIYADWLDEQGEGYLAEGWRVLIQLERMPSCWSVRWRWTMDWLRSPSHSLPSAICSRLRANQDMSGTWSYPSFFAAFTDAAVAYVRYYHVPLYRVAPDFIPRYYFNENEVDLRKRRSKQTQWEMLPYDPIPKPVPVRGLMDGVSAATGKYESHPFADVVVTTRQ